MSCVLLRVCDEYEDEDGDDDKLSIVGVDVDVIDHPSIKHLNG